MEVLKYGARETYLATGYSYSPDSSRWMMTAVFESVLGISSEVVRNMPSIRVKETGETEVMKLLLLRLVPNY
jgi:hypothetical protein